MESIGKEGYDALGANDKNRNSFWNKIPDQVRSQVIDLALDLPALSPRELAYRMIDKLKYYISESSVYQTS